MGRGVILEGRIKNLTTIVQGDSDELSEKTKKMKRKRNKQEKVFSP